MGVGNTLTLLNGRRLVMNAGYQTEFIGGDFVPTMTVNTNMIPTNGLDRLEILKDGASAIYGADAVAGVVNNVIESDYEGKNFHLEQLIMNILMQLIMTYRLNMVFMSMMALQIFLYL